MAEKESKLREMMWSTGDFQVWIRVLNTFCFNRQRDLQQTGTRMKARSEEEEEEEREKRKKLRWKYLRVSGVWLDGDTGGTDSDHAATRYD